MALPVSHLLWIDKREPVRRAAVAPKIEQHDFCRCKGSYFFSISLFSFFCAEEDRWTLDYPLFANDTLFVKEKDLHLFVSLPLLWCNKSGGLAIHRAIRLSGTSPMAMNDTGFATDRFMS
ncbi:hypothetical protein KPH14_007849 [Odynerus spinipes]|uniref:Uncharacterized protein n=1 Tax=Odynerus spinipes TaxID=1348599 RepID=A0AAD9S1I1_9HYME|nr:hypothetical protein KPH14_007849 [Odynerus spinipes]